MNNDAADKIVFKLYNPFSQFNIVKEIWTSILKECPHSYYLSWTWTEIWIKSLPTNCNLSLVVGFNNDSPVIAFFLGSKTITTYRFFKFHQIALNQTLIPNIDVTTYIEYNAILIDPKITVSLESLLNLIPIKSWDEFRLVRCSSFYQPNLILSANISKKYDFSIKHLNSYYVNLENIRRNNNDYLALVSQNRRKQIRRSIKEYEKLGEIRIQIAENVEEALNILDELIELHRKRWVERGYSGAFSTEYFIHFHQTLISECFEHGEIQLIRVSAGEHIIGCSYNFVYNRNVYAISGGFNYLPANFYLPGFVCDYFGALHNAMLNHQSYDFMSGEDEYKISLSTNHNEMQTIIIRKRNFKYQIERAHKLFKRIYKRVCLLFPKQ